MQQRKHADLIIAWANGAQIQYFSTACGSKWIDIERPSWYDEDQYRIKPVIIEEGQVWVNNGIPYLVAQVSVQEFALIRLVGDANRFTDPVFCRRKNGGLVQEDAMKIFGFSFNDFKLAKSFGVSYELED